VVPAVEQDFCFVQSQPELDGLLDALAASPRVALDTEADSLHHYFQKVCLIQLSLDEARPRHWVVDPLAGLRLEPLLERLRRCVLVLHGADYDLRMLRGDFGFRPAGEVVDTMLAAQLLGHRRPGLAALVAERFGHRLSKKAQRADWAARPLARELLGYAADDTRHLLALADGLLEALQRCNRLTWHAESCRRLVAATACDRPRDPEVEWRIPGAGRFERRALAMLRSLWTWRENEARRVDRPPFRVLHNAELLELADWLAADRRRLPLRHPRLGRRLRHWPRRPLERAAAAARALPAERWPRRRRGRRGTPAGPLLKPLRRAVADRAAELDLEPCLLAPKASLEAISRGRPADAAELQRIGGLMDWQTELLEPVLRPLLRSATPAGG
jgi:ribonuclease D